MNKICTSIEQSKKLIELGIDVTTADMHWQYIEEDNGQLQWFCFPKDFSINQHNTVSAWSLAALLRELPDTMLGKDKDGYVVMVETMGSGLTTFASNPIDACYEMVLKLKEKNLL